MSLAEFYLERPWLLEGRGDYFDDPYVFPYEEGYVYDELYDAMFDDLCESVDDSSEDGDMCVNNGGDPFKGMIHSEDTEPKLMEQRKRAMVLGKFKFLSRGDGSELENSEVFLKAVHENTTGMVEYEKKVKGKRNKTKVAKELDVRLPGYGDRFTVVWTTEDAKIVTDQAVKLYMPVDIDIAEEFSQGPKSPWFGLVEPNSTYDKRIGFDANNFWSVGLLFKHLGTCGVGKWDQELQELQRIYQWTSRQVAGNVASLQEGQPTESTDSGRLTGRITEWRGTYGFIKARQSTGPQRVFVHISDIQQPLPCLRKGTTLEFDICQDPFRLNPKAVNVVAVE